MEYCLREKRLKKINAVDEEQKEVQNVGRDDALQRMQADMKKMEQAIMMLNETFSSSGSIGAIQEVPSHEEFERDSPWIPK